MVCDGVMGVCYSGVSVCGGGSIDEYGIFKMYNSSKGSAPPRTMIPRLFLEPLTYKQNFSDSTGDDNHKRDGDSPLLLPVAPFHEPRQQTHCFSTRSG